MFSLLYNRRIFLLRCRDNQVFPNHIVNNIKEVFSLQLGEHPYKNTVDRVLKTFRKSILNIEIKITNWKIKRLEDNIKQLQQQLCLNMDDHFYRALLTMAKNAYNYTFSKTKAGNVKKIKTLEEQQVPPIPITVCDNYLVNYTNITIPEEVEVMLSLGPKFSLPPKKVPVKVVIKDIESYINIQPISEEVKNTYRSKSVNVISNFERREQHMKRNHLLDKFVNKTNEFVKKHQNIIISRADKGGATVVMYRDEYLSEVDRMLSDEDTYKKVETDPTTKIQNAVNGCLMRLKKEEYISETEYKTLIRHNSLPPKLYCLRKVHKNGLNLRPIVSCVKSPTYNIGYGKFQKFLLGVCGLIYATCAISTTTLSFVLPSAECDFHLSSSDKGKLSATPLIGMIFGCCVWGFVADSKGRRTAIMSSLLVDFLAGFISAFALNFPLFLLCRFFSGFGIIGATSIIFSYLGEFLPNDKRDTVLGRLELFWNVGIIVLPAIAWTLLNQGTFDTFARLHFYNPWRIFVLICCLPSLLSFICLYFLPETPKYFISKGRYQNAIVVFQRVYRINTKKPLCTFPVTSLYGESNNNDKSIALDQDSNYFERLRESFVTGFQDLKELSTQPYLKYLAITAISDFGLMASYYTLIMWFPEIFERFNNFEKSHDGQKAGICEVFQIGDIDNGTLQYSKNVCEPSVNNRVFIETIIIGLSCIPSSISLSFFMAKFGKKYVLVISLILSGLSTLALNWVSSSEETLVLSAIFEALTSILETVLFCVVVELFPTNLRAPALAITATSGRIGAIFGNLVFGTLIDIQCSVPIYLFGALLVGSGILTLAIPKSEAYFILH